MQLHHRFGEAPRLVRWLIVVGLVFLAIILAAWILSTLVTDDAKAADYPASCLRIDPVTGGTYNGCDGASYTAIDSPTQETASVSSSYGSCKTVVKRRNYTLGHIGTAFWVELEKHWCWKNGSFTYKPATVSRSGVTLLGSGLFWKNRGIQNKYTYNSASTSESHGEWLFECSPFGITVGSRRPSVIIYAHPGGSYSIG